jgi:hypothetical protein
MAYGTDRLKARVQLSKFLKESVDTGYKYPKWVMNICDSKDNFLGSAGIIGNRQDWIIIKRLPSVTGWELQSDKIYRTKRDAVAAAKELSSQDLQNEAVPDSEFAF